MLSFPGIWRVTKFPSWCTTDLDTRFSLFCCGQGHFYDNQQRRTGYVANTVSSRSSRYRKVEEALLKVALTVGIPTCNYELDISLQQALRMMSRENIERQYIDRCLNAWTFPAGIRTGFRHRYPVWCPISNAEFLNFRKSKAKPIVLDGVRQKFKQERTPFPSAALPYIAQMVNREVSHLESKMPRKLGSNLWRMSGRNWKYTSRTRVLLRYLRLMQHCSSGCYTQPHRSGEHCSNNGPDKLPRFDPVSGKWVDINWKLGFFYHYKLQSCLPVDDSDDIVVILANMIFGRKNNPDPIKANFKCSPNKLLNPLYYFCKQNDIQWTRRWYHNTKMWAVINNPDNRLVPFFAANFKQYTLRDHAHPRAYVSTARYSSWEGSSFSRNCKALLLEFKSDILANTLNRHQPRWDACIDTITGHSLRYEYVFREFMRIVTSDERCMESVAMITLQCEMGWSGKQMMEVYGLWKGSQLGHIQKALFKKQFMSIIEQ